MVPFSLAVDVLGALAAKALEKKAHSLEVGRSLSLNYAQTTAGRKGGRLDGCEFRVCVSPSRDTVIDSLFLNDLLQCS